MLVIKVCPFYVSRYKFPGPGAFRCNLTNLVFVMAKEAELTYMTLIWDEDLLNSGGKTPAGPLFQIKSADEDALTQLRFPHGETKEGKDICNARIYIFRIPSSTK